MRLTKWEQRVYDENWKEGTGARTLRMPDFQEFLQPSDDDETLEPWFNDTGDFGDHEWEEGEIEDYLKQHSQGD